jgi:hypothetical protein
MPVLVPHVVTALDSDSAISGKATEEQFERLLLQPLSTIQLDPSSSRQKLILVIDALDECEQERRIKTILHLLSRSRDLKGLSLRVFVTSRTDLPIRLGFQEIDRETHQDVILHEVPAPIIEHDLLAYLKDGFSGIRNDHSLPLTWPDDNDLKILVEMARPLFIFSATVCCFISDFYFDPQERLITVLRYQTTSQADKLDGTYLPVLNQLLVGRNNSDRTDLLNNFRSIIGVIVILANPQPAHSFARLIDVPTSLVDRTLNPLHSVLRVPADQNPLYSYFISRSETFSLTRRSVNLVNSGSMKNRHIRR